MKYGRGMLTIINKIVYYIKSLFVPQVIHVWNGDNFTTYVMVLSRLTNGDWLACYVTSGWSEGFAPRICECVTTSKYKALVQTFNMLKEEYRWQRT